MMKNIVFLKKELMEIIKSKKVYILPAVFLFIAFSSTLSARYIGEILKNYSSEGMIIQIPEPRFTDAYMQFYKNLTQIGFIVMILTFMGIIVDEKVRGTAILVLTKNVSRTAFVLCKIAASVILYTISYVVAVAACIYYTYLLFPEFIAEGIWWMVFMYWLFGFFIISVAIFSSIISRTHMLSAVISFIGFAVTSVAGSIPYIKRFSPSFLGSIGIKIFTGEKHINDAYLTLGTTVLLIIILIYASIAIFKKQEL